MKYNLTAWPKCGEGFLIMNPVTPRVKPWVIQSFIYFDSMDRFIGKQLSILRCGAVYLPTLPGVRGLTKMWYFKGLFLLVLTYRELEGSLH